MHTGISFQSLGWENNTEAKIPEGNNLIFPLKFYSNSKTFDFGKVRYSRKSRWLGKGLIVDVNENGKRWVSWDRSKCGEQAGKWVAQERIVFQNKKVGLGPFNQKAQVTLLGSK